MSEKVRITVRLNEEENEKLKQNAALCGLSQTEFIRQLCAGKHPRPQKSETIWDFFETLYDLHHAFHACIPYSTEAIKVCEDIEHFILAMQEAM